MAFFDWPVFLFAVMLFLGKAIEANSGDANPIYKACVKQCERTRCIQEQCFNNCNFSSDKKLTEHLWYLQESLHLRWTRWGCLSDCRYHCMLTREKEREYLGHKAIKYHGKWPFQRHFGIQVYRVQILLSRFLFDGIFEHKEPISAALSTINLALIFYSWLSFFILVHYKLPLRPNGQAYYEYTGLWHVCGILSMTSWFWSAIFHGRYMHLTERLYYSSSLASLGFALIISIVRALNVRSEAARVMIAAPLIAFVTTHILYLNVVELDYGLNKIVVAAMTTTQLLFWTIWGIRSCHPSRWKLWLAVVGGALALLLEIIDFPPYKGLIDGHALWQVINVPVTYIFWSFIRDDAEFATSTLIKKAK